MDKVQKRAILYISIISGLFVLITLQLLGLFLSIPEEIIIFFPLLFAVILWSILPIILYLEDKKYRKVENGFKSEVVFKTNGNLLTNKGHRNGNIYLENDKFHFVSLDKKPPIFIEINKGQLMKTELINNIELKIIIEPEINLYLRTLEADKLLINMIEKGFI